MITVRLYRSGVNSRGISVYNKHIRGVFTLKFKDVDDLVRYMMSQCHSVYLDPTWMAENPQIMRVYRVKVKSLAYKTREGGWYNTKQLKRLAKRRRKSKYHCLD